MYDYVEVPKPKQSGFDLSQGNKLTMDFGDMVPVFAQEVLPSDEFKVKSQFMVRMAPLANPIYTKINATVHYFFVPNRLLWNGDKDNDWQTFITGGKDGTKTPTPPYLTVETIYQHGMSDEANRRGAQTLADYLGVPLKPADFDEGEYDFRGTKVNMLPFLAYQKIYDDWYRDANVTNSYFDTYEKSWLYGGDISNGNSVTRYTDCRELLKLRKRSWKKDYFTSALPWAQRGDDVRIPVNPNTGLFYMVNEDSSDVSLFNGGRVEYIGSDGVPSNVSYDADKGLSLNPVTLGTIRDLRNASALQLWLEKNAIGGARYIEQLLAHFGVYSDDQRHQRAEYLGSTTSPVVISEVQSNAATEDAPLGKLGGKGISYGDDFIFNEKFKEHGWIIGIMTIIPEASYADGIHRSLTHRNEKLDYAFPEFAEVGLQEISNSEIYFDDSLDNTYAFGYNDRYAEYKSNYNVVHGLFRDKYETAMSQYNMTRFYDSTPELSSAFLEVREEDITSPFVDTDNNRGNLWVDMWTDCKAIRPLPKNSIPLF